MVKFISPILFFPNVGLLGHFIVRLYAGEHLWQGNKIFISRWCQLGQFLKVGIKCRFELNPASWAIPNIFR